MTAAVQEMKWFGDAVYRVKESVVLAAQVPQKGESRQRGEGVAIELVSAVNLWKADGEQWKE